MLLVPLQRVLQAHARTQPSPFPASGMVGLALPVAALGIVLIGMDLPLLGLLIWTFAVALIAYALERYYALIAVIAIAAGGMVLWRMLLGDVAALTTTEQIAFALISLLAALGGQLFGAIMRQRERHARDQFQLDLYANTIQALFTGSVDCIKLLASDGCVLTINNQGLHLIGASAADQVVGHNWFSFWDGAQQKELATAWQQVLASGSAEFNGSCRTLNGERRTWHNTFTVVRAPDNTQSYVVCVSRDITENVLAQQTLKANVAQFSSLLNGMDDAFIVLDANWMINFANQQSEQLFAYLGRSSVLGSSFWEVFPLAVGEPVAVDIRRAMEQQCVQRCELFHAQQQRWLSITAFPYPNGLSLLVRDNTVLKQAEKHITEENARLQVAQEIAGFGDWSFDYAQGQMHFSARAVTMLDLDECPQHEYKKRLLERLHPQDRMALVQAIINSSTASPRLDLIVRMPRVDGGEKHLHWVGQLIADKNGNALRMLGAIQDISAHLQAQKNIDDARRVVRDIVDALPNYIFVIDREGHFVVANRAWQEAWCRYYDTKTIPESFFDYDDAIQSDDRAVVVRSQHAAREILAGSSESFEYEYEVNTSGEQRQFVMHALPLHSGGDTLVLFSHQEITSVKKLMSTVSDYEQMMRGLTENMPDVFWIYDTATKKYLYMSRKVEELYGIPYDEFMADPAVSAEYLHPEDRDRRVNDIFSAVNNRAAITSEFRIFKSGELRWLSSTHAALFNDQGVATRIVGITRDITDSKVHEQQLLAAMHTDDLTALPNRKALVAELDTRSRQVPFALILLNLDRFKNINDTLGYERADELLIQAAARLRTALPDQVFLARFGGDEFAIVCDEAQRVSIIDAAMACFSEAFQLLGEVAFVTASIGVAVCPNDSDDSDELLKFADAALMRAKQLGRNNSQAFKATMLLPSRERLTLENELRQALPRGEFELFYQGKFDLQTGALLGAEALLRWHSHKRGLVSPADFIPLLEETGLILPVGDWVLAEACKQVKIWQQRLGYCLPMAVNVSALQVLNRAFAEKAIAILQSSELPANTIELEITESALMSDAVYGAQLVKTLKAAGFSIALDDFGTGYSSLGYLRKFMPTTLKIDRSFVADLTTEASDREIVAGIVQLAKALGINVVAEGIELVEQRRMLCELGCATGQGYLFCRPLPAAQFERGVMAVDADGEPDARVAQR